MEASKDDGALKLAESCPARANGTNVRGRGAIGPHKEEWERMKIVQTVPRLWLGTMLVYTAARKFPHLDEFGNVVRRYGVLPDTLAGTVGVSLPFIELLAGLTLVLDRLFPIGPMLSAGLGASFSYAGASVLRRGEDVPCGCAGQKHEHVERLTVVRGFAIVVASATAYLVRKPDAKILSSPAVWGFLLVPLMPGILVLRRRPKSNSPGRLPPGLDPVAVA